jgi:hypothetical protein
MENGAFAPDGIISVQKGGGLKLSMAKTHSILWHTLGIGLLVIAEQIRTRHDS